ncbi:hypothetical protein IMG5_097550 [Ichthyophthirius multifiliis]|uniref:Uncharacterized protein n=1 Tax=Ichthyophthirius multifiliis TaxID=5932 RepID=G0QRU4_ICHMU|nr:hypothetical protein IMG5_097550 [Ichthyophthirius multifiliis]EGR32078.1 hypothetical protein IMG5_097550 [Ichthyophthirius multifiliis]|eukprot:XP_004035564.1 hypothetical protein IMG5_097550 [Ichthyophthirius multifiliis]
MNQSGIKMMIQQILIMQPNTFQKKFQPIIKLIKQYQKLTKKNDINIFMQIIGWRIIRIFSQRYNKFQYDRNICLFTSQKRNKNILTQCKNINIQKNQQKKKIQEHENRHIFQYCNPNKIDVQILKQGFQQDYYTLNMIQIEKQKQIYQKLIIFSLKVQIIISIQTFYKHITNRSQFTKNISTK